MASLPALPDEVAFDTCCMWQTTLRRLDRQRKPLPDLEQLFDLLIRGPICAFDVLNGVVASHIRYPPGWLQWRIRRIKPFFSFSCSFQEAFKLCVQRGGPSFDVRELLLCADVPRAGRAVPSNSSFAFNLDCSRGSPFGSRRGC